MLATLIYGVPTWEMASASLALIISLSLIGLIIAKRLFHIDLRRKHNEFIGFNSALVGVFFAVLLAFIAVSAWESFSRAGDTASNEASLAGDLARDAQAFPEPLRIKLLIDMRDYVDIVLKKEWPAMANGDDFGLQGWEPLEKFHTDLVDFRTQEPIMVATYAETLTRLNSLYDARRARILAASQHIDATVWWVVLLGSAVTIAFTFLFGMESMLMHVCITSAVAASLGLVIVLIAAFDYPFRGEVQITPGAFQSVHQTMERQDAFFLKPDKTD